MMPVTNTLDLYKNWSPQQRGLFEELAQLALTMHDKGKSSEQIVKAMRRRVKRHQSHSK